MKKLTDIRNDILKSVESGDKLGAKFAINDLDTYITKQVVLCQEKYDQGFHDGANKTAIELSKDFEPKDSDNFKEWLKRKNITRDSNKQYSWSGMNYPREFFFDKFIEYQRREN